MPLTPKEKEDIENCVKNIRYDTEAILEKQYLRERFFRLGPKDYETEFNF
jgi:hypothetical protein